MIADAPRHFIEFRTALAANRARANKAIWPNEWAKAGMRTIGDAELDLLLYAMLLRTAQVLEAQTTILWARAGDRTIEAVKAEYRTAVVVDEAPDFSALQLGCMYYLTHPALRSFSIGGDLMQRVTAHGLQSWEECKLFAADLQVHQLAVVYRQNRKLLAVAADLYRATMNQEPPFISPFPDAD